jgi:hypothetical protein
MGGAVESLRSRAEDDLALAWRCSARRPRRGIKRDAPYSGRCASPRQASDLYTRLDVVWPALCRAVACVEITPPRDTAMTREPTSENERPATIAGYGLKTGGVYGTRSRKRSRASWRASALPKRSQALNRKARSRA